MASGIASDRHPLVALGCLSQAAQQGKPPCSISKAIPKNVEKGGLSPAALCLRHGIVCMSAGAVQTVGEKSSPTECRWGAATQGYSAPGRAFQWCTVRKLQGMT